jgi:hypothetical protein
MPEPPGLAGPFWRVFPWDPAAPDGGPYSVRYVPPAGSQTGGRFDLGNVPVLYLAEQPEHAVAELLQRFRGKPLRPGHLRRHDRRSPGTFHPLVLVQAYLPGEVEGALPDLGDPVVLDRLGIRPDHLASQERRITQAISRKLHDSGLPGFRWWSALTGDWHVSVLYLDRVDVRRIAYRAPDPLSLHHPVVHAAARLLRMPFPKSERTT